jgi:hypothetical protein
MSNRIASLKSAIAIIDGIMDAFDIEYGSDWWRHINMLDDPAGKMMRARRHLIGQLHCAEFAVWQEGFLAKTKAMATERGMA